VDILCLRRLCNSVGSVSKEFPYPCKSCISVGYVSLLNLHLCRVSIYVGSSFLYGVYICTFCICIRPVSISLIIQGNRAA